MCTSTEILAFNTTNKVKEPGFVGGMASSRTCIGKMQDEPEPSCGARKEGNTKSNKQQN